MVDRYIAWRLKVLQGRIDFERAVIEKDGANMSEFSLYQHRYILDRLQRKYRRLSDRVR